MSRSRQTCPCCRKIMPATTPKDQSLEQSNGSKKNGNYGKPMYVRCDLSAEQKSKMQSWADDLEHDELMQLYDDCQSDGYVFSAKPLEQGYQASLTPAYGNAERTNGGKCLVTRASTPQKALLSLFFKHSVLLSKNWQSLKDQQEFEW
jgi:hypothetical protein